MTTGVAKNQLAGRVSRETMDRLELYHEMLIQWQKTINLVAPSTLDSAWERHFADSAQLFDLMPETATRWLDLGSGGGFPGLVIAAMSAEKRPNFQMTLIESDIRKCGFMREVARKMDVSVKILSRRISDAPKQNADVVSARALSSLATLAEYALNHAAPDACLLFPKGATFKAELESLPSDWQTATEIIGSVTDPDAVILRVSVSKLNKDN